MSKPILSICIPTYNREKILVKTLIDHLEHCPDEEVEIIICADGSTSIIKEFMKKFYDQRIKLQKNEERLGIDASILKSIEIASGDYIMLLSDEDYIKWDSISWVLDIIRKNKRFSQILGVLEHNDKGVIKYYYNFKNRIWKARFDSIIGLFYTHNYLSGLILRKSALDLNHAKKYIGSVYMCNVLAAFAMMEGDTISTSRVFCIMGEPDPNVTYILMTNKDPKVKKQSVYLPLSRFFQMHYRKHLIYDLAKENQNMKNMLLNRERKIAAGLLAATFCKSPYEFMRIAPYIFRTREYSKKLIFWRSIPIYFYHYLKLLIKNKDNLKFFIKQLISPNNSLIMLKWPNP